MSYKISTLFFLLTYQLVYPLLNDLDYQVLRDLYYNTSGPFWTYQDLSKSWQFDYVVDLCGNGGADIWEGNNNVIFYYIQ